MVNPQIPYAIRLAKLIINGYINIPKLIQEKYGDLNNLDKLERLDSKMKIFDQNFSKKWQEAGRA